MGEEWDVTGMVEGYSIDGPQAPPNVHSFFENRPMIEFQIRNGWGTGSRRGVGREWDGRRIFNRRAAGAF